MTNVFHIEAEEGCDYSTTFLYEDCDTGLPIDLSRYKALLEVRENYDGANDRCAVLTLSSNTAPGGYGIILGGTAGTVQVVIRSEDTLNLNWSAGVYDLVLISPAGKRIKFVRGFLTVFPSATISVDTGPTYQGSEMILVQSGTPTSVTGETTETVLAEITVPPNAVKPNGVLRISTFFQVTSSASTKSFRVKVGDVLVNEIDLGAMNGGVFETCIFAADSGLTQSVWSGKPNNYRNLGTWTSQSFDMTQEQIVTITGQLSDGADEISLVGYTARVINP